MHRRPTQFLHILSFFTNLRAAVWVMSVPAIVPWKLCGYKKSDEEEEEEGHIFGLLIAL